MRGINHAPPPPNKTPWPMAVPHKGPSFSICSAHKSARSTRGSFETMKERGGDGQTSPSVLVGVMSTEAGEAASALQHRRLATSTPDHELTEPTG